MAITLYQLGKLIFWSACALFLMLWVVFYPGTFPEVMAKFFWELLEAIAGASN